MIHIYNTLTRQKEVLTPLQDKKVNIYICGVTVYDYCHLGHARTYLSMDVVIRYLRARGYAVNYVRNITDIDDKIIKRAHENGETFTQVTARFIQAMQDDFAALLLLKPDHEPRATDYMPQIISLIEKIIAHQHAYVSDGGDVYFDVRSYKDYGCLSNHNIEQLESGARVQVNELKRDPLDFALWKLAKPDEPAWDSPWGKGRPGWHIECSAMCMAILGEQFDIHAGGRDLIFPHHENEIAQSQVITQKPLANLWMHGGYLQVDKEKMSKSLGNFVTIREVLSEHSAEVIRYAFIASHYRSPLNYTDQLLQQSKQALSRLYTALRAMPQAPIIEQSTYEMQFIEAMDDDFNTPVALSVLFDLAHHINRLREEDQAMAAAHAALLKSLGAMLGILQANPDEFFQADHALDVQQINDLIAARDVARREKNWGEADRIRQQLLSMSVAIDDTPEGTTWKRLS